MPHQCTDCGTVYDDGSREMLNGCDDCGGTTFAYTKDPVPPDPDAAVADASPSRPAGNGGSAAEGDGGSAVDGDGPQAGEDPAQARARSGIIEADEEDRSGGETAAEPSGGAAAGDRDTTAGRDTAADHPPVSSGDSGAGAVPADDLEEVREELMAQFESIKIVEPGSYELNLMNLYDRDETIIALQEDGRYQVSLPSVVDD